MEEIIENFIDSRINDNYYKLRETKKWQEYSEEFQKVYTSLFFQLSTEQKEELDKVNELKNLLMGYESHFAYKLGARDTYIYMKK